MPTLAMLRALPWKWIGLGLILAALAIQTVRLDASKAKLEACEQAREADRQAFRNAAAEAQRLHNERVAKIEADKRKENERITREYQGKLANAGALVDRMRKRGNPNPSSGTAPGGDTGAGPGADGSRPGVCLTREQAEGAARNEIRLLGLQDYVRNVVFGGN